MRRVAQLAGMARCFCACQRHTLSARGSQGCERSLHVHEGMFVQMHPRQVDADQDGHRKNGWVVDSFAGF